MKGLVIETRGLEAFVGVMEGGKFVRKVALVGDRSLSKMIFSALQQVLEGVKVDYVAVGTGPGSFTGTRVGVTIAQTLSFAWGVPLQIYVDG